jgi:hypothetical protein
MKEGVQYIAVGTKACVTLSGICLEMGFASKFSIHLVWKNALVKQVEDQHDFRRVIGIGKQMGR